MNDNNSTTALLAAVEDLAATMLVQTESADAQRSWIESLQKLADAAQAAGRDDVAATAFTAATDATLSLRQNRCAEVAAHLETGLQALRDGLSGVAAASPTGETTFSIATDPELMADFILEAREHLENIEAQLLSLEQNPTEGEALNSTFRSFHSIKGLAGFLELPRIQEVAHEVETVLDVARRGDLRLGSRAFDVILASKDYLAGWLRWLESPGIGTLADERRDNTRLLSQIRALLNVDEPEQELTSSTVPRTEPSESTASEPSQATRKTSARSVKVDTEKLDFLVDMVGEMVIAQSLVRHDPGMGTIESPTLNRNLAQLARITEEVQRTAMSMRMVPIGPLFQRMARLVRDLSRKCGKQIGFECEGEEVELDRNIVEELADPLMHMVRNAVDHGIESVAERVAAGKNAAATVALRAFHRSGQIVIEVSDDGAGINKDRVLAKAVSKGLVGQGANLSDSECYNLIFAPGFSTAEVVSDVSGRGVGMDVVKKQIQKLRGSVDISSVRGEGTTFSLRLPLTLAIIDGLVVAVGSERYIIPLASVKELLRPAAGMVSTVENRAEIVAIRDRLLPVIRLYERFGLEPRSRNPEECVLVCADVDGACFCLMVDDLIGKQEVVIKSLGPVFSKVGGVAGGAILGDGKIGLILDLKCLFGEKADVRH